MTRIKARYTEDPNWNCIYTYAWRIKQIVGRIERCQEMMQLEENGVYHEIKAG